MNYIPFRQSSIYIFLITKSFRKSLATEGLKLSSLMRIWSTNTHTFTDHVENELKLILPKINQLKSAQKYILYLYNRALGERVKIFLRKQSRICFPSSRNETMKLQCFVECSFSPEFFQSICYQSHIVVMK